ncbi:MAG: Amt family ammonium transporter [Verrucomicrobiales bacterium]|jgi:Amt family ammonium transporter
MKKLTALISAVAAFSFFFASSGLAQDGGGAPAEIDATALEEAPAPPPTIEEVAAAAADAQTTGNTAWMLTSTALVLFMTLPGLALFYGGLVHKRNVLSVLMHCFALACVMSIVWLILGYSFAIGDGEGFFGGFGNIFHCGVAEEGGILTSAFQMTFFIITPALIIGAFVERFKFSAMLLFSVLWSLLVYAPVCHWTWFGGFFSQWGVEDLAGGIVVHITAGVAALIACIMVGRRKNISPPHNLPMTVMGTSMLWVGWFGFNAGSTGGAGDSAAMTLLATHMSAATGAFTWAAIEWFTVKKPSVLGICTGAIAGLAAITPASGVASPAGGFLIGLIAGIVCYWASVKLKNKIGYDDSLDVVGVHGVGGLIGVLMAAVVGNIAFLKGGDFMSDLGNSRGMLAQLGVQLGAVAITIVYTAVLTIGILLLVKKLVGLRVEEQEEIEGLDQSEHGETAYNT